MKPAGIKHFITTMLLLLVLTACNSTEQANAYFLVKYIEAEIDTQPMTVYAGLELKFSPAVEEALNKGVTIPIKAIARITRDERIDRIIVDHGNRWEIRYLPMSRHYLLTDLRSKEETTWPRLRHALASLKRIAIEMPPAELKPGDYRLEVKIFLDRRRLPAPMRLPALVSSEWKLDTSWYQWPFQITK